MKELDNVVKWMQLQIFSKIGQAFGPNPEELVRIGDYLLSITTINEEFGTNYSVDYNRYKTEIKSPHFAKRLPLID